MVSINSFIGLLSINKSTISCPLKTACLHFLALCKTIALFMKRRYLIPTLPLSETGSWYGSGVWYIIEGIRMWRAHMWIVVKSTGDRWKLKYATHIKVEGTSTRLHHEKHKTNRDQKTRNEILEIKMVCKDMKVGA